MKISYIGAVILLLFVCSCKPETQKEVKNMEASSNKERFKIGLAQWSFHKALQGDDMDNLDFADTAASMGFEGIEYVSQFFQDKVEDIHYLNEMGVRAQNAGIESLLIMVDDEGDLAHPDSSVRKQAVLNHYKWIDAAKYLGCHSIRVNLFGEMDDREAWIGYALDGLGQLVQYGASQEINVIVENHGWLSSDAGALVHVIETIGSAYCGTLPDFGNFCLKRANGELWGGECLEEYDRYKGVKELLPYARSVSAKSYDFDSLGLETTIDYSKMMDLIKNSDYKGYISVEYEGDRLTEREGVLATKALIEKLLK